MKTQIKISKNYFLIIGLTLFKKRIAENWKIYKVKPYLSVKDKRAAI